MLHMAVLFNFRSWKGRAMLHCACLGPCEMTLARCGGTGLAAAPAEVSQALGVMGPSLLQSPFRRETHSETSYSLPARLREVVEKHYESLRRGCHVSKPTARRKTSKGDRMLLMDFLKDTLVRFSTAHDLW